MPNAKYFKPFKIHKPNFLRIAYISAIFIITFLGLSLPGLAQSPCNTCSANCDQTIPQTKKIVCGNYADSYGPYYVKVYLYFVVPPDEPNAFEEPLPVRSAYIWNNWKTTFSEHRIFFVSGFGGNCDPSYNYQEISSDLAPNPTSIETLRSMGYGNTDGIDVYIFRDVYSGPGDGGSLCVPSSLFYLYGKDATATSEVLSNTPIVSHEMAHCLGLLHTNEDDCLDVDGSDCKNKGDMVCDTPPDDGDYGSYTGTCAPSTTLTSDFLNIMSAYKPPSCLTHFTPGQGKRMRYYLENKIEALANVGANDIIIDGTVNWLSPMSPAANIIIKSGGRLNIYAPVTMRDGAHIYLEAGDLVQQIPGGQLFVYSTITAACDFMWQGIIVRGNAFEPQDPATQGWVSVESGGKIEHAHCAIDVQDLKDPIGGTGGGIVTIRPNAQLENNTIGIRFGQYTFQNKSNITAPIFSITDDYRGGTKRPVFVELNVIKGLNIKLGRFWDLRTQCSDPTSRAIGIDSKNAGFRVSSASNFKNLYIGIRTDQLTVSNGAMSLSGSNFIGCYKGVELTSSGSFSILNNNFTVKKPDACPSLAVEVKGVEISAGTAGFTFQGNDFIYDNPTHSTPTETLIGTDCIALGEGIANTIFKNSYTDMTIGNRASGDNGYNGDGLLYLCNTNLNSNNTDFRITNGKIRKVQGVIIPGQTTRPTGNVFSGDPTFICTILNDGGNIIDYSFYDGDPSQDPGTPGDPNNVCIITGFERKEVNQPAGICVNPGEPCFPCPNATLAEWKLDFHQNHQQWLAKTAGLSSITDSVQRAAEIEAISHLRIAMNQDGSRVLMQYNLDTLNIEVDSIIHWLGLIQTYSTDLRLAKHYFFTGDYSSFYSLWGQIPNKYFLEENQELEFDRLGEVYNTLRAHLQSGVALENLPDTTVNALKIWALNCDESGFLSKMILWRNGLEYGPDCSSSQNRPFATSSTGSLDKKQPLKIFPNPANDLLQVEYPTTEQSGQLRIFDLQGGLKKEIILPASGEQISIPVHDLSNGLYLIHWRCNGTAGRSKVVIAR